MRIWNWIKNIFYKITNKQVSISMEVRAMPAEFVVNPGDRFAVSLMIDNATPFHSIGFNITWPTCMVPSIVSGNVEKVDGDLFAGKLYDFTVNNFTSYLYLLKALRQGQTAEAVTGKEIAKIIFTATGEGSGTVALTDVKALLYTSATTYDKLPTTTTNAEVVFTSGTIPVANVAVRVVVTKL